MPIKVLYEDKSIIIVEKPAGIATQTANVTSPDCVSLIKAHIKAADPDISGEPYVGVVHRLDQPVAGILVFAKNKKAAASLSEQVRGTVMNKHYTALVEGILDQPEDVRLCNRMYKDNRERRAVIVSEDHDMKQLPPNTGLSDACLIYHTEKILKDKNMTLLSIKLETGRFHQIRVQLSNIGHPIAGDGKYGASTAYPSGIALVADSLEFRHPDTGEKVEKVVDFSFCL